MNEKKKGGRNIRDQKMGPPYSINFPKRKKGRERGKFGFNSQEKILAMHV